ncbi:hypothetical protein D9M68_902560 [compost metagenome]
MGGGEAVDLFAQAAEAPVDAVPARIELRLQVGQRLAWGHGQGIGHALADAEEKLANVFSRQAGAQVGGHAPVERQPLCATRASFVMLESGLCDVHTRALCWSC